MLILIWRVMVPVRLGVRLGSSSAEFCIVEVREIRARVLYLLVYFGYARKGGFFLCSWFDFWCVN
jgi:hypothetical protein